jgi:hypothetical protein
MARLYELWDGETGNLVGAYASEQDALAAVSDAVHRYGPAAATTLALAVEDERGEGGLMVSGASLIERAEAVARSFPVGVGGLEQLPDSRERDDQPSGEACGETMAAATRDREAVGGGYASREDPEHSSGGAGTGAPAAGTAIDRRSRSLP